MSAFISIHRWLNYESDRLYHPRPQSPLRTLDRGILSSFVQWTEGNFDGGFGMSNAFDEVRAAVQQAKIQLRAADSVAFDMAFLLRGRLRQVSDNGTLNALKRELADWDMHRKEWK